MLRSNHYCRTNIFRWTETLIEAWASELQWTSKYGLQNFKGKMIGTTAKRRSSNGRRNSLMLAIGAV